MATRGRQYGFRFQRHEWHDRSTHDYNTYNTSTSGFSPRQVGVRAMAFTTSGENINELRTVFSF